MSQKNLLPPDAGISVIVPVMPDFVGLPRIRDAWETQLSRLGRPIDFHVVEEFNLGAALRAGIRQATQPWILLVVPDFAFRPSDVRPLLEATTEADMAIGVRPGQQRSPTHEKICKVMRWINRVIFGIDSGEPREWYGWAAWRKQMKRRIKYGMRLQDPECGLRLVRRDLLHRCPIQSEGRFALVEMIAKINFAGAMLAEVPLSKPGDLPKIATFATHESDEQQVFSRPTFADHCYASDSPGLNPPSVQSDADSCAQTHPT